MLTLAVFCAHAVLMIAAVLAVGRRRIQRVVRALFLACCFILEWFAPVDLFWRAMLAFGGMMALVATIKVAASATTQWSARFRLLHMLYCGLSDTCRPHPARSVGSHHWPFNRGGVGWWRGLLVPPASSTRPTSPRCRNRAMPPGCRDYTSLRAGGVSKRPRPFLFPGIWRSHASAPSDADCRPQLAGFLGQAMEPSR